MTLPKELVLAEKRRQRWRAQWDSNIKRLGLKREAVRDM